MVDLKFLANLNFAAKTSLSWNQEKNRQLLLVPNAQFITIFVSGPLKISLLRYFSHLLCLSKTLIFHVFLSPVLTCLYFVCFLSLWNDKVKLTRYSQQLCKENIILCLTWLSILIKLGYLKDNPLISVRLHSLACLLREVLITEIFVEGLSGCLSRGSLALI